MSEIPGWALRLIHELLDELGDRFGNDGCNDYDLPDYVPKAEILRFVDGDDEDEDREHCLNYNFVVCHAMQRMLRAEARRVAGEGER